MDKFRSVILVAGFGCFIFSVLLSALYPALITDPEMDEVPIRELAQNVLPDFKSMKETWPVAFERAFDNTEDLYTDKELILLEASPEMQKLPVAERKRRIAELKVKSDAAWPNVYAQALELGRNRYISDACWHCHSQFVRPVANEELRYGPVNTTAQDNHSLQRPMLWGTRRVGPDLTYEGGKRSNDWHAAHLFDPQSTSPGSVMPKFPYYSRTGYRVFRRIDPNKAKFGGLDVDTAIGLPGIFDSQGAAEEALANFKANLDPNRAAEGERMFVAEGIGPNEKGLALIAYLQWLGTWLPPQTQGDAQ